MNKGVLGSGCGVGCGMLWIRDMLKAEDISHYVLWLSYNNVTRSCVYSELKKSMREAESRESPRRQSFIAMQDS